MNLRFIFLFHNPLLIRLLKTTLRPIMWKYGCDDCQMVGSVRKSSGIFVSRVLRTINPDGREITVIRKHFVNKKETSQEFCYCA